MSVDIINDTPLRFAPMPGRIRFPGHSLTLIVKGTFDLAPGEVASLADEQILPTGDEPYADDKEGTGSIRYPSDFVYAKPKADLLLVGSCYPPDGQPAQACRVSFQVGNRTRSLAVFGDRSWSATQPVPFNRMDLRYENSFGGAGYGRNPVGKGMVQVIDDRQRSYHPVPNIEDIQNRITSQASRPEPAGFGPIAAGWEQRLAKAGTYRRDYKDKFWPWFPEDFDWGYFNSAPPAMQLDNFLRGDETLFFENLDREVADFRARLPGLRPRCFIKTAKTEHRASEFGEVPMGLDTLWVDMDARKLVLVWRGWTDVEAEDYPELSHLYVAAEWLDEEAGTVESYNLRMKQRLAELNAEGEPVMEEPPPEPAAAAGDAGQEGAEDEPDEGYEQLRAALLEAGIDPDNPPPLSEEARLEAQRILDEIDRKEQQEEPAVPLPAAAKLTREDVIERIRKGEHLDTEDLRGLDLSQLDMGGASLAQANLEGASLINSNLEEADLTETLMRGADLSGANLAFCNLARADLTSAALKSANLGDADLTGAKLTGADLSRACLDRAVFEDAEIHLATMTGVSAREAMFVNANLTGSSLKSGQFEQADFSGAMLERVNFDGADLKQSTFVGAHAPGVSMVNADLTGLRASGGVNFSGARFTGASAGESNWEGADLTDADLSGVEMEGAYFGSANLVRASLYAANMKFTRFPKADLSDANLTRMNLFQGSFEKAKLSGADISGSNMYGAEFLDAELEGLVGSNVNLKMTKLDR